MNDKQILLAMQDDSDAGLRLLIDQYMPVVTAVVRKILSTNTADVEECVADAFLKFWQVSHTLSPEDCNARAYLICIARNTAINRYHSLKRQRTEPLENTLELLPDLCDVEKQVLEHEQTELLLEAINKLTEPSRTIMIRRYFFYEPLKVIAGHLGITETSVKNRIQYVLKKMRKSLVKKGVSI